MTKYYNVHSHAVQKNIRTSCTRSFYYFVLIVTSLLAFPIFCVCLSVRFRRASTIIQSVTTVSQCTWCIYLKVPTIEDLFLLLAWLTVDRLWHLNTEREKLQKVVEHQQRDMEDVEGGCRSQTCREIRFVYMIAQLLPQGECNDFLSIYIMIVEAQIPVIYVFYFRLKTHCSYCGSLLLFSFQIAQQSADIIIAPPNVTKYLQELTDLWWSYLTFIWSSTFGDTVRSQSETVSHHLELKLKRTHSPK